MPSTTEHEKRDEYDAGKADTDLQQSEHDHERLVDLVKAAVDACAGAVDQQCEGDLAIVLFMRAMQETHASIQAILVAAQGVEAQGPTGRWIDGLVLARLQYDVAFLALLVASDAAKWLPRYRKAGWAAEARRHFYVSGRFENTPVGKQHSTANEPRLKEWADSVGVTAEEFEATRAEVLSNGKGQIKRFPTPGQALKELSEPYRALGHLLYPQWRFLCGHAHSGCESVALRDVIRGGRLGSVPNEMRPAFIDAQITQRAIGSSLVAIMSVASVLGEKHQGDDGLCAAVTSAWKPLYEGTVEGSILWGEWARQALGAS